MPEPGNSAPGWDFNLIRLGAALAALIYLLGLSSLGNQAQAATELTPAAYQPVYSSYSAPTNTELGRNNRRTSHEKGHLQPAFGAPTRLILVSGSNQQITISHTFTEPLVAKVTDVINTPVSGEVVTFTIASASNGASATFAGGSSVYTGTTDSSGLVTTTLLTANSHAGSYAVNVSTTNGLNTVSFNLTNLAGPLSSLTVLSGNGQSAVVNTAFAQPFAVRVADAGDNPLGGLVVTFTAPAGGPSGTFAGGSAIYTGTTNSSGIVTSTTFSANGTIGGPYNVTGKVKGLASSVATFQLFNLAQCSSSLVTSDKDDGSCGTLREAIFIAGNSQSSQTVTITLSAGSVISLTTGLTLTNGVAITTTAQCGTGPNNTMVPPITLQGVGTNSGDGLTLAATNRLYGLWVRGFSGLQIHAPVGSHTIMQCVRASKT